MRLKTHGKLLFVAAMAAGLPIACGGNGSSSGTGGSGGTGGSNGTGDTTTGSTTTGSTTSTTTTGTTTASSTTGVGGGSSSSSTSTSSTSSGAGGGMAHPEWPTASSSVKQDPAIEQAIKDILAKMKPEEKVAQLIQTEAPAITPAEMKQYHIGSVLNGGGGWPGAYPGGNKDATVADWVTAADAFYNASIDTSDGGVGIPYIWGTDALHGQNKMKGATLFPHNIGLGAANNPDLLFKIGQITAQEVAVEGLDWTFAPCLAAVQDDRWGRTYESYSEDPAIVRGLAASIVEGIQGQHDTATLLDDNHILATAKHFLGDGGTRLGVDQGDNVATEQQLIDIHAQGYYTAIQAGAQTVMASYNKWNGLKMHGNKYLLTDILKGKLGFDGFVIGDWNGHAQIPGCTNDHCPDAINAGVDMLMVPDADGTAATGPKGDWKNILKNTLQDVKDGKISQARLDDAVTRILRVKMRFGLLGPHKSKGAPSTRANANKDQFLGSQAHRDLARQAVRESLVLLKNKGNILPLKKTAKVLLAGKSADNLGNQAGGWTIDWQGANNVNTDFPGATSVYKAISSALTPGPNGGTVALSADGTQASAAYDVAVVVIGETPYAEFGGDIGRMTTRTMEHAIHHPEDLAVINTIKTKAPNLPIVTIFFSGRPLFVNKELNRSNAFIAAWLPGSEGGGITDVLFGDSDFKGKLSFSWPSAPCQVPINKGDGQKALFSVGFGLTYKDTDTLADNLDEASALMSCSPIDPEQQLPDWLPTLP